MLLHHRSRQAWGPIIWCRAWSAYTTTLSVYTRHTAGSAKMACSAKRASFTLQRTPAPAPWGQRCMARSRATGMGAHSACGASAGLAPPLPTPGEGCTSPQARRGPASPEQLPCPAGMPCSAPLKACTRGLCQCCLCDSGWASQLPEDAAGCQERSCGCSRSQPSSQQIQSHLRTYLCCAMACAVGCLQPVVGPLSVHRCCCHTVCAHMPWLQGHWELAGCGGHEPQALAACCSSPPADEAGTQ